LCSAVPNYKKRASLLQPDDLRVEANISSHPKQEGTWLASMQISTREEDIKNAKLPYVIFLQSFAILEPCSNAGAIDPENLKELLYVNGATMMYTSAREYLRIISAPGPYGPIILPTWRFSPEDIKQAQTTEEKNRKKTRKSKEIPKKQDKE